MKIILFSACDDNYSSLLLEMMESLGEQLKKYDFGLLDLGLSDSNKDKIRKLKSDVIFEKPKWFLDLPEYRKNIFSQAMAARPFIKEVFPNYDGYMQIDADVWFLDNSVVDDFIEAAAKTGFSLPTAQRTAYKTRYTKVFGKFFFRGIKSYYYKNIKNFFGTEAAIKISATIVISPGVYFLHADSPAWEAWQESMKSVKWYKIKKSLNVCDQTCLIYAFYKYKFPHTLMSLHHHWIMPSGENDLLLDKKNKRLLDSIYPHTPIKALHLSRRSDKMTFKIKSTDGEQVATKLTRTGFLETVQR